MTRLGWILLTLAAAGCAPTFDWRDVSGAGAMRASFPCRPLIQARPLSLAGVPVDFELRSCEAGGLVFALGSADLGDPYKSGAALTELAAGMRRDWLSSAAQAKAHAPLGATPHASAGRWRFQGTRSDGSAAFADVSVFVHGTRVYRATVTGAREDTGATEAFQAGLRLQP